MKRHQKILNRSVKKAKEHPLLFIGLFAAIGAIFLGLSYAATPSVSLEPENGTVSSPATLIADSLASNGKAVQFVQAVTPPPATGCSDSAGMALPSGVSLPSGTTKMVFDDEFSGAAVDTNCWTVMNNHADVGNGELPCYKPDHVSVSGGSLMEKLEKLSQSSANCPGGAASYTSGAVQMKSYGFTYGTIEARIKFGAGSGVWPAFWLLGTNCQQPAWLVGSSDSPNCNWPNPGSDEIDIAEYFGNAANDMHHGIHASAGSPSCSTTIGSTIGTAYHTYTLVWSPGKLVFKVDGTASCTLTQAVPSTAMFTILNTSYGGAGGSPNDANLPQTTSVDYVRVFQ